MTSNPKDSNEYILPDSLVLDLPDSQDYKSFPPDLCYLEVMKLCEQELPYTNAKNLEERKKHVNIEPFTFKD